MIAHIGLFFLTNKNVSIGYILNINKIER